MNITELIARLQEIAKTSPAALVCVDNWPIDIDVLPAYYDGPVKIWDAEANTIRIIRGGTKVVLRGVFADELAERLSPEKLASLNITIDIPSQGFDHIQNLRDRLARAVEANAEIDARVQAKLAEEQAKRGVPA